LALAALLPLLCPAASARPNVIIVTVDAMRADCLAAYGCRRGITPNLDRLAAAGVIFTDASCPIPLTNGSMTTFFTSKPPWLTGATRNGINMLPGNETLADILRAQGYTTAAVVASWPLQSFESGLARSFDFYEDEIQTPLYIYPTLEREARWTTRRGQALLRRGLKEPFLLWLHYADPHQPHLPPPSLHNYAPASGQDRTAVERYYDQEVAYADHWIGVLFQDLQARGLLANALIVLSADHGENLGGQKKFFGHGRRLYSGILHIPFVLIGPGLEPGRRFNDPVHTLDFAPTILACLGLPPGKEMQGRDLMPAVRDGAALAPVPMFYESYGVAMMAPGLENPMRKASPPVVIGMREGNHKLIYTFKKNAWEMYDLGADPDEMTNLYRPADPEFQRLGEELRAYYAKRGRRMPPLPDR
jgi:arylsulfatase A-like enzyme